jgi:capsule polysaccharide export protein KpsE/RkpR
MELIATAIATAIATIGMKSLEKIGENTGDMIWKRVDQLINKLRQKKLAPQLTAAVDENKVQELHYDQAVRELTEAMQDEEIKEAVLDLESSVNTDTSNTAEEIKNHPSVINNNTKLAEIINAEKGSTVAQNVNINNQHNHYN